MSYTNQNLYRKSSIDTANPIRVVILLYEAAIKNIEVAAEMIDNFKKYDKVTNHINKTIDIVTELRLSLDFEKGKKIAQNLNALYDFVIERLKDANLKKERSPLDEAKKILVDLLQSWEVVEKQNKKTTSSNPHKGFSISC